MNGPVLGLKVEETADREEFRRAVLDGLSARPRAIPAKYLYDARGSALFDEICELPEYYLTRTETEILKRRAAEIGRRAGPGCALIEFGSGSSVKSRLLIEALPKLALYAPIDISREHLDATAAQLKRDYPKLRVEPVCADFMGPVPPIESEGRRLGFFPGSTIGNLTPEEATAFLHNVRTLVGNDGALVLGADLKKDPQRLHDAYNDSAGVTAAFTLNLLRRMNRELQSTFDLSAFAHEAFYDEAEGRIEIYVRSLERQTVMVAGQRFEFAAGGAHPHRVLLQVRHRRSCRPGQSRRLPPRRDVDGSRAAVRGRLSGKHPGKALAGNRKGPCSEKQGPQIGSPP